MPKLDFKYDGEATVKSVEFRKGMIANFCVETPCGHHGYPSMFLLDEDGKPNLQTEGDCKELFGASDPTDLSCAVGVKVNIWNKKKGEYWNTYFSVPSRKKSGGGSKQEKMSAEDVRAQYLAAKGGAPVDLSIPESSVPF